MEKVLNQDQKALIRKHGQKTIIGFLNMGIMVNLENNKSIFVPCNSKKEVLSIEYNHITKIADLSIYENRDSYLHKLSFWQKIRYCYNVLLNNKPYVDQILLDKKQLKDLFNFLQHLEL